MPPPPPPPPPMLSQACTEKPALNKSDQLGRSALLSDICKTKKLKKTVTNDRSAPVVNAPKGSGGGGGGGGGGPALGGLFTGGMPKLRSAGTRDNSDSGGARPTLMPPSARLTSPRPFVPNNAPPKLPGSSSFPRSSNPEPPRNKFPPPSQPKSSRPDIGSRSDAGPPPVPSAPRPSLSSTPSRGPPPFPGNRPLNTGPSLPNRNQGSSHHFSPTPPHSNTNRSHPTHSSGRVVEDKPSPSTLPTHNTNRPPLPPTPARMMDDRPPPPPMMNRPMNRDGPPPPPPQHHKPPVPQTPRPTPSFQAPPPPPPNRPGPPQSHHGASTDAEIPRLPQRNMSLHGTPSLSPGTVRSGPLPPSERPPPPVRDPPSRSGPLPPPPPGGRNGGGQKAPPVPQPPSRMGLDNMRGGFRPPLPPDRGSPVPPPTTMRNGFQESSQAVCEDEWEGKFSFHSISDLPPPEPYVNFTKTYPSKQSKAEIRDTFRTERGAPPLPPIPPTPR